MARDVSEQEKWEEILRKEGLTVGRGDTVPTVHVGTIYDLELLQGKITHDSDPRPEQQENQDSTDWDKSWSYTWNHLYNK